MNQVQAAVRLILVLCKNGKREPSTLRTSEKHVGVSDGPKISKVTESYPLISGP